MKDRMDLHTHTLASGHAYSTIKEMAEEAARQGLEILGITDHTSSLSGGAGEIYFSNLRVVPRNLFGVRLLMGCELNILDSDGRVDLPVEILEGMDIAIASIHPPCYHSSNTIENNTNAVIQAMKNPHIHIIGHPDDSRIPLDYERVVQAAKEEKVLLELNNSSVSPTGFRQNAAENIKTMLGYCKEYNVPVIMGSDAHIFTDIGNHKYVRNIMSEIMFPEELVINYSVDALKKLIKF